MDLSDHKTATYCEIMQQPDVYEKKHENNGVFVPLVCI